MKSPSSQGRAELLILRRLPLDERDAATNQGEDEQHRQHGDGPSATKVIAADAGVQEVPGGRAEAHVIADQHPVAAR